MTYDDIDTLWYKAVEQSIAAGKKFTRYSFVELLKREMIRDGWRQCAKGQRTTQFCAMAEDAVKAEREACAKLCESNAEVCNNNSMLRDVLMGSALAIRARGYET